MHHDFIVINKSCMQNDEGARASGPSDEAYWLPEMGVEEVPSCAHGPTLLFPSFPTSQGSVDEDEHLEPHGENPQQQGEVRYFFGCSAFRDRELCPFFLWADEYLAPSSSTSSANESSATTSAFGIVGPVENKHQPLDEPVKSCGKDKEDDTHTGGAHRESDINAVDIRRPTRFLRLREERKGLAQFMFDAKALDFLVDQIVNLRFARVLCLGTPRLHEHLLGLREAGVLRVESLLLDFDERFGRFFEDSFVQFNMCNFHFFENPKANMERLARFLRPSPSSTSSPTTSSDSNASSSDNRVLVVMDPPYGVKVSILAGTLKKLSLLQASEQGACPSLPTTVMLNSKRKRDEEEKEEQEVQRESDTKGAEARPKELDLVVIPYFFEERIKAEFPSFEMLDYQVGYDNHSLFRTSGRVDGMERPSPVRVFTNWRPLNAIRFPLEQGYRYCQICSRYVANMNIHCDRCNACTSKDGRCWRHCKECRKCVKPGHLHCVRCDSCHPPNAHLERRRLPLDEPRTSIGDTRIETEKAFVKEGGRGGCWICGDANHKKRDCVVRLNKKKKKEARTTQRSLGK